MATSNRPLNDDTIYEELKRIRKLEPGEVNYSAIAIDYESPAMNTVPYVRVTVQLEYVLSVKEADDMLDLAV